MEKEKTTNENEQKSSTENFKDLLRNTVRISKILWQEMPWFLFVMVFLTIIIGALPVFASKAMGTLIDKIILATQSGSIDIVYPALILFAIFTALPSIIRILRDYYDRHMYLRLQDTLEIMALKKRGSFDIAQYENTTFQDRLQRAFNNGIHPIIAIVDVQISNLEAFVGIVVGSIAAATIDWRVFLLVVLTSIPDFWVEIKFGGRIWGIWAKNSAEQRRYQDLRRFFQHRHSIIDGRLNQVNDRFLISIKNILTKFTDEQLTAEHWKTIMKVTASSISTIGLFIGLTIIIRESLSGAIAIGTVVFAFQTLNRVSGWTSNMLSYTARLLERNLYVTDIFSVFDQKLLLPRVDKPTKLNLEKAPIIKFENVSFKYPGQEKWALQNLNLTVEGGQKLGLVGNNGSGKSTLVRLLLRIHDPIEGRVTIDGIDLKNVDIEEWWSYLGILLQDFTTYNFTVRESIAVGEQSPTINDEKVKNSAVQSTSHGFIDELKDKYENMIGVEFGGIEPSKGQRQKLAIARAFYKGNKLLVLDEPTASIDAESASLIFREIENLSKDISAILISHNFATIKKADTIAVLENGKIVEEGTHDELLALNKNYAEAYKKQKDEF